MAFNIRVYGLLINAQNEVLLSDENRFNRKFTKFPGGGLEEGEGLLDCVVREFQEELSIAIEVEELFYLTDFYQPSAFDAKDQIISVYYLVKSAEIDKIQTKSKPLDFSSHEQEVHRWIKINTLKKEDVTFPIDKIVVEKLVSG